MKLAWWLEVERSAKNAEREDARRKRGVEECRQLFKAARRLFRLETVSTLLGQSKLCGVASPVTQSTSSESVRLLRVGDEPISFFTSFATETAPGTRLRVKSPLLRTTLLWHFERLSATLPDGETLELPYYLRARQSDGHCVWVSPIWVDLSDD